MRVGLENDLLQVMTCSDGAEIISIKGKKDGIEYLWTADSKYWGRHAPILFPIVGKVKNNKYRIDESEFNLTQHGFARDLEFELIENTEDKAVYKLMSSYETLKKYPYKFELYVEYVLNNNNLEIKYRVKNKDDKKIYFSIGAHPGFNCPILKGEKIEDYYLEFDKKENVNRELLDTNSGLYTGESEEMLKDSNVINLSKKLFEGDAVVFKNLASNKIYLKNNKNKKVITVDFSGFPYLGIWSKTDEAPFVCIEPWFGCADFTYFNGDFRDKIGVMSLEVNEEFNCKYIISIEQ